MDISVARVNQIFKSYQNQSRIAELNKKANIRSVQGQMDWLDISPKARKLEALLKIVTKARELEALKIVTKAPAIETKGTDSGP